MGNIVNAIKKFIGNKTTLTILVVIVGVCALWFGYNYRIKKAVSLTSIPCASNTLNATDPITEDDIKCVVKVTSEFIKKTGAITSKSALIGKHISTGTSVPEGGVFFAKQVVDKKYLNNTIFDDMEDGYTPYALSVTNHSTFGNSIYPGDRIDLYMKATDSSNKILFGKLIESIEVLAVFDSSGNDVFALGDTKTPAELIFSVENEMYELLMKTEFLSGVTLIPVPRNKKYTQSGAEVATSEYLRNFILSKTAAIPTN